MRKAMSSNQLRHIICVALMMSTSVLATMAQEQQTQPLMPGETPKPTKYYLQITCEHGTPAWLPKFKRSKTISFYSSHHRGNSYKLPSLTKQLKNPKP